MMACLETQSKICSKCKDSLNLTDFSKNKSMKDGLCNQCKSCSKARGNTYYYSDPDRESERKKAYRLQNSEYVKSLESDYRSRNRDRIREGYRNWYTKNSKYTNFKNKLWRNANRDLSRSYSAKRRSLKLQAYPPWISEIDKMQIEDLYTLAKMRSEVMGKEYHIDHVHPINHHLVCGLHIPGNLQILTAEQNLSKSNKFEPYVFSECDFTQLWQA